MLVAALDVTEAGVNRLDSKIIEGVFMIHVKRLLFVCLLVFVLCLPVFASGQSDNADQSEKIVIAVVPQQLGNPVFLATEVGAKAAAKELGVKLLWEAAVEADAPSQVQLIEGLIAKGVDGIALSCNDPDALKAVINKAVAKGIAVSTFDADSPDSNRSFYAGTLNYHCGELCGEYLIDLTGGKGTVALLTGNLGQYNLEQRMKGFKDAINGTDIEIVTVQACKDDLNLAIQQVEQYTAANPNLDSWFFVGGWPFFAPPESLRNLLKWREGSNKTIVTMDAFLPMLDYFDRKAVDVAVGQDFEAMGRLSVEYLYKVIKDESVDEIIDTGEIIVTPENYSDYKNSMVWN